MKKIVAFLLLLMVLTLACGAPLPAAVQNPAIENTALPTQPVQFTSIPTVTTEIHPTIQPTAQVAIQPTSDFPTFTPPTAQPDQPNQIRFPANGTYADVTDYIPTGSSKTYIVNAMKGQVMSVSILPQIPSGNWGYIPMQVKGRDGSILCPQSANSECMFWRGALPASQDYFITLTPNGDVAQFVMRVAINPPGKDAQYFQFNNPSTGLSLTYPDTFAPAIPVVGNYKITPELTLHFIDSKTYDKTNLSEMYLFVGSSSDAQMVATCTQPNQNGGGPEQVVGNEVVDGFTFVHSTSQGVGAGNIYEQEIYRMVNKNICYEVTYYLHSTNVGNYTPGTVAEFDRNAITQKLYGVFSTFTIK
jgi:hypothetical protein